MVETTDRRVARTRRLLADALIGLILERGYDRITVQDILDRADVGRSTFYAHFRDKQALLLSCFDGLRDELHQELHHELHHELTAPSGEPQWDAGAEAHALFAHAYRHRRVYRALCGRRGGGVVYDHLHKLIGTTLAAHLTPQMSATPSPVPVEVLAEFCTSGLLGLLIWWVGNDFPQPPAQLARMYTRIARPGIEAVTAQS